MIETVETPNVLVSRNPSVRSTFAGQKETIAYLKDCKRKGIEFYSDLPISSTIFMVFDTFEHSGRTFALVYERAPQMVADALLLVELDDAGDVESVLVGTTLRESVLVDHAYPMMIVADDDGGYFGATFTVAAGVPAAAFGVLNPVPAKLCVRTTLNRGK